jgi:hypothetical protein
MTQPGERDDHPQAGPNRNLPQFDDLPIAVDTADLEQGPALHPQCEPLAPLIGVWRGKGEAMYPSLLGEFPYGQQLTFAHDGRPFLYYEARAWLLSSSGEVLGPSARELGWLRVDEDEGVELVLTHSFGICEIYYGERTSEASWEFHTDQVVSTKTGRETNEATRLYGLVEDDELAYVEDRALRELPLQPHLSAQLRRIIGS